MALPGPDSQGFLGAVDVFSSSATEGMLMVAPCCILKQTLLLLKCSSFTVFVLFLFISAHLFGIMVSKFVSV